MTAVIIVPLLVLIAGLMVYVLATNAKVAEIGRAMLWCGLLVTLFVVASKTVKLF